MSEVVGVPVDTVAPLQFVAFTAKPPFTEVTFIASLNVTLTEGAVVIPVALFAGVTLLTVGAVVSGVAAAVAPAPPLAALSPPLLPQPRARMTSSA